MSVHAAVQVSDICMQVVEVNTVEAGLMQTDRPVA